LAASEKAEELKPDPKEAEEAIKEAEKDRLVARLRPL
jgi:hypothetical protein